MAESWSEESDEAAAGMPIHVVLFSSQRSVLHAVSRVLYGVGAGPDDDSPQVAWSPVQVFAALGVESRLRGWDD